MKIHLRIIAACLLIAGIASCTKGPPESVDHYYRLVSFRSIPMQGGQRIAAFEVVLSGAHVRALNRIPDDWSMNVTGPVSEVSKIDGIAGHGAGWLDSPAELDRFATILVVDTNFDIRGTIVLAKGDEETELVLTKGNFKLEKKPNQPPERTR